MDVKCALIWGGPLFGICPPFACDPYMRCVLQVLSLEDGHERTTWVYC